MRVCRSWGWMNEGEEGGDVWSSSSVRSRALRISSTSLKWPSLSSRSASSRTRNLVRVSHGMSPLLELMISHSRPGVPVMMSAFASIRCCFCSERPPVSVAIVGLAELTLEQRSVRWADNWWASSRVGDRIRATGGC